MASKSGFETEFLGPVLFFSHVFNTPIKLVDGSSEAATRGSNTSGEGPHAGLSRKCDKAKKRACWRLRFTLIYLVWHLERGRLLGEKYFLCISGIYSINLT